MGVLEHDPFWVRLLWLRLGSFLFVPSFLPFLGALFYGVCQGFIIFISIQYTKVTLFIHVFDIGSNQQGLKEEIFHEVKKWTQSSQ